jgi:hypothetical protein
VSFSGGSQPLTRQIDMIKKHILVTCVQVHDLSVLYGSRSLHDDCDDFDAFSRFRPKSGNYVLFIHQSTVVTGYSMVHVGR